MLQWHQEGILLGRHQVQYSTSTLGLGGTRSSLWKWRFNVPDMKPELLPFGSVIHQIISQVLASGSRTEYQFTSPDDGGIGGIWDRNKEEEMLKQVEMGKNSKESLTEMSEN